MLKNLHLHNVGPAPSLEFGPLAPRLNLVAGDNGLGKTFLLDATWFAMTQTWAGEMARPIPGTSVQDKRRAGGDDFLDARIEATFDEGRPGTRSHRFAYHRRHEEWYAPAPTASQDQVDRLLESPHPGDGIVIYARVDGGFCVWDAARNPGRRDLSALPDKQPLSFIIGPDEVWKDGSTIGRGLVNDWLVWQGRGDPAYRYLESVLHALHPHGTEEHLEPGKPGRVSINPPREYPTLKMPYGREVPVPHLSAAYRRIISFAYILAWAWNEHLEACKLLSAEPTREFLLLVDEVEMHLHPGWQRTILRSLLAVVESLTGQKGVQPQVIAATHSPLVLASAEPRFDPKRDAVWELDLVDHMVELKQHAWTRRGDASAWLTSDVFDLESARSLEAEDVIRDAMALTRAESPDEQDVRAVTLRLQGVLSDTDRLWVGWASFAKKHGVDA